MVTRMDQDIATILAELKTQGIDNDTIVFFTSDNGPHTEGGNDWAFFDSNGPYRGIKRDLYDGGIRVPMIVRWPGRVPAGVVSDFVWGMQDFMLTAAELARSNPPQNMDGISVVPTLLGQAQTRTDFLYWEFMRSGDLRQAVREGNWKAVRYRPSDPVELYDLSVDPGEATDVSGANPVVLALLKGYLDGTSVTAGTWPTPWTPAYAP